MATRRTTGTCHTSRRPQRRVRNLVTLSAALFGSLSACALAAPTPTKASTQAMHADSATLAQLSAFLREYHAALRDGNRRFLERHTRFPLPFAQAVYDMEAKTQPGSLASMDELIGARTKLLWPDAVLPQSAAEIPRLRRGAQKCSDPKSPEVPDWSQGEPAYVVSESEVQLTYLAQPCESETHMVTLVFAREGASWLLRQRSVRMGRR